MSRIRAVVPDSYERECRMVVGTVFGAAAMGYSGHPLHEGLSLHRCSGRRPGEWR